MITNVSGKRAKTYVDWVSLAIYFALVVIGWLNIYATVYDETHSGIFDLSQRQGMQLLWIGVSFLAGLVIMLLDDKYYHMFAYFLYGIAIISLVAVLIGGTTVNGAKAWISIGSIRIQPAEFVKFATALALARYMSRYTFSMHNLKDLIVMGVVIGLPAIIIILQNDTGSALVYGAFLFPLYREGLNRWVYIILAVLIILFVMSLLLEPATLLILMVAAAIVASVLSTGKIKDKLIYLSAIALAAMVIYFSFNIFLDIDISLYLSLLIPTIISIPFAFIYAYKHRLKAVYHYVLLLIMGLMFTATTDYVFDNVLQVHQQKRILSVLGLEDDPSGWGYNVNQSKIAIGSGGFAGKGYLDGTQTKYDFVPEQSTDFIFSTLGEEWGFLGSALVVILFCILIIRLADMGERQREPFGRIYCYSVAAIFFTHVVINIGMTIGIMPVIGIPLPFFSYGGSSFLAFSLMFFVALRLDSGKRELLRN